MKRTDCRVLCPGLYAAVAFFFALSFLCLLGAKTAWPAQPEVIRIVMASVYPAQHPVVQKVWLPWAQRIKEQTGGKLEIIFHGALDPYNSTGPVQTGLVAREYFDAVRDGRLGMAHLAFSAHPGDFTYAGIFGVPSRLSNSLAGSEAFWTLFANTPEVQAEFAGIKVLAIHSSAPYQLGSAGAGIVTQADLRGRKILSADGHSLRMLRALGASSQVVPPRLFAETIRSKNADGCLFPLIGVSKMLDVTSAAGARDTSGTRNGADSQKEVGRADAAAAAELNLAPVLSGVTLCNLRLEAFWLGINQALYDSLPPDCKAALDSGSGLAMSLAVGQVLYEADLQAQKDIAASGVAVRRLSEPERLRWIEAALPLARAAWFDKMPKEELEQAERIYARSREIFEAAESKYFTR